MKILSIRNIRNLTIAALTTGAVIFTPALAQTQRTQPQDRFERTEVTASGTTAPSALINAPTPYVYVLDEEKTARFVVDITDNILYEYDESGIAQCAYKVASGKKKTPTTPGIRVVSHTETYPYRTAPKSTKRRKNPGAYGPRIIYTKLINPKTGEITDNGEFIHGNCDPKSIGQHASGGCIRMDNEVIKDLAEKVKRGDIIIIKK